MLGKFITFEGPDGSGKTSVLNRIRPQLEAWSGKRIVLSREPGGSQIAEEIRSTILNPIHTEMDPRTEALLYAASRRQHLVERVIPSLEAGDWVISDRYIDSSMVYQGVGRGIGIEEVYEMNQFATEGLMPELTIYLDIRAEVGLARIQKNRDEEDINRLDQEALSFHQEVRKGYLLLLDKFPERIKKVDAEADLDTVADECLALIKRYMKK